MSARYPLFVKRDLDGFFGLAVDNLVQMLLIVSLCGAYCGMTGENGRFIYQHILPGAAVSLLIGNLFYAAQAHYVARRERRSDVTALPYGINTPSLLVYVFFVMAPAYARKAGELGPSGAAHYAWQLGLVACLGSGLIEFGGAFFAERLRRNTPRAALLSTLAGIDITFSSMAFALQIWQRPLVAMLPLAVIILTYFARVRFPIGLPGGLMAVLIGTGLAWGVSVSGLSGEVPMSTAAVREASAEWGRHWPIFAGHEIWDVLRMNAGTIIPLLSVIIPMGLFNLIGSLQNIESAEAGGDVFATGPSLAVNGVGTIAAAFFGSCFPTTIYIGHPGWKALGARAGYSTLNGVIMSAICLSGTVLLISKIVPIEAGIAIVLWIGIIITAQAFQATPVRHAPAVAVGLFPAIAAWGATVVAGAFITAGLPKTTASVISDAPAVISTSSPVSAPPVLVHARTMQDVLESKDGTNTQVNGFFIHGMNIMDRGYIFTCMILAAIAAFLIDRRFFHAAGWALVAAVLTLLGMMHAYQVNGNVVDYLPVFTPSASGAFVYRALPIAGGYALMAAAFLLVGYRERLSTAEQPANTLEDARAPVAEETV